MVGENWLNVAGTAMRLGIRLYVIPLTMIANRAVIRLASEPLLAGFAFVRIAIGLWALSYAFIATRPIAVRLGVGLIGLAVCFLGGIAPIGG